MKIFFAGMASYHSRFYVYMIKIYLRKMEGFVMKELENVMSQLEKETKKKEQIIKCVM